MPLCLPLTRHLQSRDLFGTIDRIPGLGAYAGERSFEVFNPSTGELLAKLPDMGAEETRAAVNKAYAAQPGWAALTARERSDILWRWHQLIVDHAGDLAAILTAEMGKPLAEARSEVAHERGQLNGLLWRVKNELRRYVFVAQPVKEGAEVSFAVLVRRKLAQSKRDRFRPNLADNPHLFGWSVNARRFANAKMATVTRSDRSSPPSGGRSGS